MPPLKSAVLDQTVAALGCLAAPAFLASRWHQYTPPQRCYMGLALGSYLSILLLPLLKPRAYAAARNPMVWLIRVLNILPPAASGRHTAVRLAQAPTGSTVRDFFLALTGEDSGCLVLGCQHLSAAAGFSRRVRKYACVLEAIPSTQGIGAARLGQTAAGAVVSRVPERTVTKPEWLPLVLLQACAS